MYQKFLISECVDLPEINKMEYRCKACDRDFNSEESLNQHNLAKHSKPEKKKVNWKKYFIITTFALIVLFSILSVYSYAKKPGEYDDFAKCLTEKGAVVYGNDYCSYTVKQLNFFGKSKKHLNYVKCAENEELCNEKNIQTTPTWEVNNEFYPQVQTFERLSAVTGCAIN